MKSDDLEFVFYQISIKTDGMLIINVVLKKGGVDF